MSEEIEIKLTARAFSKSQPAGVTHYISDLGTREVKLAHYGGGNVLLSVEGLDADIYLDTDQVKAVFELLTKITQ